MRMGVFSSIERIMEENGLPVPSGHGNEKLDKIARIVETHEMPEDVRQRLRNLLALG
jgi:hypothetical protein